MIEISKMISLAQSYLDKSEIPYSIERQNKNGILKINATDEGFKICVTENKKTSDSKSDILCSVSISLNGGVNIFYDASEEMNYRIEDNTTTCDKLDITTITRYSMGYNKKEVEVITSHQVKRTINANAKNGNIRTNFTEKRVKNTITVDKEFNFLRGFKNSPKTIGTK